MKLLFQIDSEKNANIMWADSRFLFLMMINTIDSNLVFNVSKVFTMDKTKQAVLYLILILSLDSTINKVFSQNINNEGVQLEKVIFSNCDQQDAYIDFQNRITSMDTINDNVLITIRFSMNCCLPIEPVIYISNNKLNLWPYDDNTDDETCFCRCCYTVTYDISGLLKKKYPIYFMGKAIELIDEEKI